MGQMIQFGQVVQKIGIDRFDCVDGVTVKGILLNYAQPYVRNMAFDEVNRCYVECTKEMAIKYGLNPSPRYYFILASFVTDVNDQILGDKEQKVTFIQMSENQYRHFLAASNNLANWHGYVTLAKIKKSGRDGKDFSYIEATPADDNAEGFKSVSQALHDRIDRLIGDKDFINTAVQLIDAATGLYEDKYLERIEQNKQRLQQPQTAQQPQMVQQPQQQVAPQLPPTAQNNGDVVKTTQTVPPQLPPQPTVSQQPDDFGASSGDDLPF